MSHAPCGRSWWHRRLACAGLHWRRLARRLREELKTRNRQDACSTTGLARKTPLYTGTERTPGARKVAGARGKSLSRRQIIISQKFPIPFFAATFARANGSSPRRHGGTEGESGWKGASMFSRDRQGALEGPCRAFVRARREGRTRWSGMLRPELRSMAPGSIGRSHGGAEARRGELGWTGGPSGLADPQVRSLDLTYLLQDDGVTIRRIVAARAAPPVCSSGVN